MEKLDQLRPPVQQLAHAIEDEFLRLLAWFTGKAETGEPDEARDRRHVLSPVDGKLVVYAVLEAEEAFLVAAWLGASILAIHPAEDLVVGGCGDFGGLVPSVVRPVDFAVRKTLLGEDVVAFAGRTVAGKSLG